MQAAAGVAATLGTNASNAKDKAGAMLEKATGPMGTLAKMLSSAADASVLSRLQDANDKLQQCLSLANVAELAESAPGGQLKDAIGGLFGSISLPDLGQVVSTDGVQAALSKVSALAPTVDVAGMFANASKLANATASKMLSVG